MKMWLNFFLFHISKKLNTAYFAMSIPQTYK